MTSKASVRRGCRGSQVPIWWLAAAALLLVIAANAHLLYVATTSMPGCVAHVAAGEGGGPSGALSAADSSCTSQPRGRDTAHPE
jgi:hypothetical protein